MKKLITTTLIGAALCATAGTAAARGDNVRIGTNVPYVPMEYQNPDGSLTGFDIDLGNALCKQAKLECSWTEQSWNGIIPGLKARKFDAIMSSMTITKERSKQLLFSDPYIVPPSAWFVPDDSDIDAPTKASLKGKDIGVQRGTVQDDYVTDMFGDEATIKRYANADDVIVDMDTGRLDAAFFDFPTGLSGLLEPEDKNYKTIGKKLTEPKKYFGDGFGIAFRQRDKDLAAKFNKALAELKEDGTYDKIYDKYFHSEDGAR
ncbi:transporter substrate-binding domain-containing protein [Salinisphaera aquimarina]|uniref:Transporter substrate-binding domain-containing protein n=1 Tax=Salinisphaera aquimarina TaxID=2094031 RepID=A0ABV7ELH8_9GAMM